MADIELKDNRLKKKRILKISGIFIGIMLLLTFFSNTIINFSLPRVVTENISSGVLIKELTGEGTVNAKEILKQYIDQGRLVDDVKVKLGDTVKKGQVLVVLNIDDLKLQIKEEELKYEQMKLKLERLSDIGRQTDQIDFYKDMEIEEKNIKEAEDNVNNMKSLFDEDAVSGEELKKAENSLLIAKREYTLKLKNLKDVEHDIKDQERDIKDQEVNIKLQEINIEKLKNKLNKGNKIISPVNGIISELNITKGEITNNSKPIFSIADLSKGFEMKVTVDEEGVKYLKAGDEVEINIKSLGEKSFNGKLKEITENLLDPGEKKDLIIDLPQEGLVGGEQGEIYIGKKTKAYNLLVSNTAVGTDDKGKFVWVLKARNGLLGDEFYVQRASILTDDSDSSMTAVLNGLTKEDIIIVQYNKNLSEGSRVVPDN